MAAAMFLEAYISKISCSFQWGGNGGTAQVTVVEDPINNVIFNPEGIALGTPVFLSVGSFSMGGIFKRSSYKESTSGRTFDVVIESPSDYLDGIQAILTDFNGYNYYQSNTPNMLRNTLNVYGYEEMNNGFGSAQINSAGCPAQLAVQHIETLSAGGEPHGGLLAFGPVKYTLDLSNIAAIIPAGYRLSGPVQSVSSIVQDICEVSGHDYWVDITGSESPFKLIVKTVDKGYAPNTGAVSSFVETAKTDGYAISADNGSEFAAPVTHKTLIGGPVSRFFVATVAGNARTIWGKDSNSNWITGGDAVYEYNSQDTTVVPIIVNGGSSADYFASLFEVRCAMAGRDSWETFKSLQTALGVERNQNWYTALPDGNTIAPWVGKLAPTASVLMRAMSGVSVPIDFEPTDKDTAQKRLYDNLNATAGRIYAAVSNVANNFYGRMFWMRLDGVPYHSGGQAGNVRYVNDDIAVESTWENVDSAFVENASALFSDPAFFDGSGRIKSGAAWGLIGNADYSSLGGDWSYTPDGGIGTFKGGPQPHIYWLGNTPYAVCDSGGQVFFHDSLTTADYGFASMYAVLTNGNTIFYQNPQLFLTSGGQNLHVSVPPSVLTPLSFGICQQSNVNKWGPWQAWSGGNAGKTEVVFDDTFVPESFGSFAALDEAAFATVQAGIAQAVPNETGSVTLVGTPNFNIGDRFDGSGPYITGLDISEDISGQTTTYKFNTWTPERGKLAKFNIDRMQKINRGLIAAAQQRRSQITKQALPKIRFEKSDIADVKESAQRSSVTMMHSFINEIGRGMM